jgi:hypothetical protein
MLSIKIIAGKTATNNRNEIAAALVETEPFVNPKIKNLSTSYKFIPSTPQGESERKKFCKLITQPLLNSQSRSLESPLADMRAAFYAEV